MGGADIEVFTFDFWPNYRYPLAKAWKKNIGSQKLQLQLREQKLELKAQAQIFFWANKLKLQLGCNFSLVNP